MGERQCVRCEKTPKASTVTWKGLYAGRRGACTAVIEAAGRNYAVAQALLRQDDGHNVACLQEADHTARVVGWNEAVSEVTRKVSLAAGHTSLSVARRLGSNKGAPSTNNLVALSLMCSIVPRRSCDSSCRAGSRSPSAAVTAFAQSSRIRSSILRCGGDIGS
jgi:hypothetical protein